MTDKCHAISELRVLVAACRSDDFFKDSDFAVILEAAECKMERDARRSIGAHFMMKRVLGSLVRASGRRKRGIAAGQCPLAGLN